MNKFSCDYLVIIHRIFIDGMPKKGGVDIIIDYLIENQARLCLVEHSLEGGDNSLFSLRNSLDRTDTIKKINIAPTRGPFRWLGEIFVTASFIRKNFDFIPYCIAVDPLSVLQALLLKRFKKVGRIYFHCIDYSKRRFKNCLLNGIYHHIYRFALNRADICGAVSRPMIQCFSDIVKDKDKLFFIPNTRIFKERNLDFNKRNKYSVVIMSGRVDDKNNYRAIINALASLKSSFPDVELKIIGKIEDELFVRGLKDYVEESGLDGRVSFLGFFPNPGDLEDVLANSGIGMTAYIASKVGYYMEYADSLKIREYASYGLPIVADGICDTVFEAQRNKCGFVADTAEDIEETLRKLWGDDGLYREYCRNALDWARKNDKRKILKRLIEKITERSYED